VSGESWTIPCGAAGPGNTNPDPSVPMNGSTYWVRSEEEEPGAAEVYEAAPPTSVSERRIARVREWRGRVVACMGVRAVTCKGSPKGRRIPA
jgi:hypothetical protein